jgi:hypothetical protein
MSNSFIDSLIEVTNSTNHQAQYIPQPSSSIPSSGCTLPALLTPPTIGAVTPPSNVKACVPLFVQFPLVPEPFPLPENCPSGISFTPNTQAIGILNTSGMIPYTSITVGITPGVDVCHFNLDIPPTLIIPCYPTGPLFSGVLQFKMVGDGSPIADDFSLSTTRISGDITQPCTWNIDTIINLPTPNCAAGISFQSNVTVNLNNSTALPPVITYLYSRVYSIGQSIIDTNGNLQTVTAITGDGTSGVTAPTWAISGTTVDHNVTWTMSQASISNYAYVDVLSQYDYYRLIHGIPPTTKDCGSVLLGNLELGIVCPSGLSVGGSGTATFLFPGDIGYSAPVGDPTIALSISSCNLNFGITNISFPALKCASGYTANAVSVTSVKDVLGNTVSQTGGGNTPFQITPSACLGLSNLGNLIVPGCAPGNFVNWYLNSSTSGGTTTLSISSGSPTTSSYLTVTPTTCGITPSGSFSFSSASSLGITDGTTSLSNVSNITFNGMTVGGTSGAATVTGTKLTDGTTTLNGAQMLTFVGGTLSGTTSSATITISPAGSGLNYRGVWSALSTYNLNDVAVLGAGTSSGMYICLINSNTNSPDTGTGWFQACSYATWL